MKKIYLWLKNKLLKLKAFAKHASNMLFSGKAFRKAATKTRTVGSYILFGLSILALVPSAVHIMFDMVVHGPAMITSAILFRIGQAIHGPYTQEA